MLLLIEYNADNILKFPIIFGLKHKAESGSPSLASFSSSVALLRFPSPAGCPFDPFPLTSCSSHSYLRFLAALNGCVGSPSSPFSRGKNSSGFP